MPQTNLPWPGVPLSHLGPVETPVVSKPPTLCDDLSSRVWNLSDNFRHSGWKPDRERILQAMYVAMVPFSRMGNFADCGNSHWIMRNIENENLFRTVPDYCHDRFCVPCGLGRQFTIRRNLAERLTDEPHRFATFTLRHHGEPLAYLVKRLYACFRKLRNRRLWKEHVTGGAAFLEVTYSDRGHGWHPHLHVMLQGDYFDIGDLRALWLSVTGDSKNVKIEIIRNRERVVHYVTKYATKPLPADVVRDQPCLVEAIQALRGTRMIVPFGAWKNWKLLDEPSDGDWTLFAHLKQVRYDALGGDHLCSIILAMIPLADPVSHEFEVIDDGPAPDE